jgi:hypothetical protein
LLGLNAIAAYKGGVVEGINDLQDNVDLYITETSHNFIQNFDNYQWEAFNGKPINVPVEGNDHAPDLLRYVYRSVMRGVQSPGSASAF